MMDVRDGIKIVASDGTEDRIGMEKGEGR